MWLAILLSSKSCCRLWSGCLSWLFLLLGLILLVCSPRRLTFPSPAPWLLLPPLLVEQGDALHLVSVGSQVLLDPHQSHCCKGLSSTLAKDFILLCEILPRLVWLFIYLVSLLSGPWLAGMLLADILAEACFHFCIQVSFASSSVSWPFF